MITTEIRKNLIEHYEQLYAKGALMSVDELKRIRMASDSELFRMIDKQRP